MEPCNDLFTNGHPSCKLKDKPSSFVDKIILFNLYEKKKHINVSPYSLKNNYDITLVLAGY